MAKKQQKKTEKKTGPDYKWIRVIPVKGHARNEKREFIDGVDTGRILETRRCRR